MSVPGTVRFPTNLDTADSLIRATNATISPLNGGISSGATTLTLGSGTAFPTSGVVTIDSEIITYTGKATNDLTGLGRGAEGTSAAAHLTGVDVALKITARHHTVLADALIATETKLGSGSDTPANGEFMKGTGTGTSAWSALTSGEVTTALGITPIAGVTVQDEGTPLATLGTTLNFVGSGVVASGTTATKTLTISGGGAATLDDLTDVAITSAAAGHGLFHDGSGFRNRSMMLFDLRDFGGNGNGIADNLTPFTNAIAAAAAWSGTGDYRAGVVFVPAGTFNVTGPIVLPRHTITYVPSPVVHIVGVGPASHIRGSGAGWSAGQGVIQWATGTAGTGAHVWNQRIANVQIEAPQVALTRCLHLNRINTAVDAGGYNPERFQLDLDDVLLMGSNQYQQELIYAPVMWFSEWRNVRGDSTQDTVTYDTMFVLTDDSISGAEPGMTTDFPGISYCIFQNCGNSTRRGGYARMVKGRFFRSSMKSIFCGGGRAVNGSGVQNVYYDFINSHTNIFEGIGSEGMSGMQFKLTRCRANLFLKLDIGTPSSQDAVWQASHAYSLGDKRVPISKGTNNRTHRVTTAGTSGGTEPTWSNTLDGTTADGSVVWTAEYASVGDGLALVDSSDNHFLQRSAWSSQATYYDDNLIRLVSIDNNSIYNTFEKWLIRGVSAANEISIGSGAGNYVEGRNTLGGAAFTLGTNPWGGGGSGDVVGPSSSVDAEVALFNSTTGKLIKRASASGIAKLTSGVLSAVTAPSGALVGDTDTQTLTNKTLTTPTIASLTNATHTHLNAAGGANITAAAISDFSEAVDDRVGVLVVAGDGTTVTYNDAGGTLTVAREDPAVVFDLVDDYASAGTSSSSIGTSGWTTFGGTAGVSTLTGEANHPGIIRKATGTTQNSASTIYLNDDATSAQGPILLTAMFDVKLLLRLNSNDANTAMRAGWSTQPLVETPPEGAFLEKLAADTTWFYVTRSASTATRTNTSVTTTSTWVALWIYRKDASTIGFRVATTLGGLSAATEFTQATNQPGAVAGQPFIQINNSGAAVSKTFDLDWSRVRVTGISR